MPLGKTEVLFHGVFVLIFMCVVFVWFGDLFVLVFVGFFVFVFLVCVCGVWVVLGVVVFFGLGTLSVFWFFCVCAVFLCVVS